MMIEQPTKRLTLDLVSQRLPRIPTYGLLYDEEVQTGQGVDWQGVDYHPATDRAWLAWYVEIKMVKA
jgi:hypothetical protein